MSEAWNIKSLEDILAPSLENGEKIVGKKISPLTAPGENYGSTMLRIDLDIKDENTGKEKSLNIVAKLIPESEKIQEVFDTKLTFRNEYQFYAEVVPTLDRILKSKGISSGADFTAPFSGGRINLNDSEVVDSDAVILMQNLKLAGYTTGKKSEGFDVEVSKVVLNSLAKFHAAGIALKQLEPETLEKNIKPYLYFYLPPDYMYNMVLNKVVDIISNHGFSSEELDIIARYKKMNTKKSDVNKIWGTITHYDSWTNNFLIKYEDTKPVHAMIVDFQVADFHSPLDDVMFFLLISVKQELLEENLDPLLEHYYKQLLGYLKKLEVDTHPFTKSSFEEEIKYAVKNYEYAHVLWMLFPIMHEEFKSLDEIPNVAPEWSEKHVQRIVQLTRICLKRGWLSA